MFWRFPFFNEKWTSLESVGLQNRSCTAKNWYWCFNFRWKESCSRRRLFFFCCIFFNIFLLVSNFLPQIKTVTFFFSWWQNPSLISFNKNDCLHKLVNLEIPSDKVFLVECKNYNFEISKQVNWNYTEVSNTILSSIFLGFVVWL